MFIQISQMFIIFFAYHSLQSLVFLHGLILFFLSYVFNSFFFLIESLLVPCLSWRVWLCLHSSHGFHLSQGDSFPPSSLKNVFQLFLASVMAVEKPTLSQFYLVIIVKSLVAFNIFFHFHHFHDGSLYKFSFIYLALGWFCSLVLRARAIPNSRIFLCFIFSKIPHCPFSQFFSYKRMLEILGLSFIMSVLS